MHVNGIALMHVNDIAQTRIQDAGFSCLAQPGCKWRMMSASLFIGAGYPDFEALHFIYCWFVPVGHDWGLGVGGGGVLTLH